MSQQGYPKPTFELGLVMAGAVSAGAYTAGVVDFLLQALDAWYDPTHPPLPGGPPHDVKIKVMSGASAGGMTAALVATLVNRDLDPVTQVPPPGSVRNKLYEAWVRRINIQRLLETADLEGEDKPVTSLLDATVLDEIAEYAFREGDPVKDRPYFDQGVRVLLSLTNLRGVPYNIRFSSETPTAHELSLHADYVDFAVGGNAADEETARLDPRALNSAGWEALKQAALATGAFPVGLPPRALRRDIDDYAKVKWRVPLVPDRSRGATLQCRQEIEIPPQWPPGFEEQTGGTYDFLCVDGGLMNNEPVELARRILAGDEMRNPREGDRARRAVLMIDPFPDAPSFRTHYRPDKALFAVLGQMFSSLRAQASFKIDEVKLAYAQDVYSRFLIAPSRGSQRALACGSLGAFGGFFSERFREHDFQLGRHNCQSFLRKYFTLPEGNPLFEEWPDEMREQHRRTNDTGQTYLPIIPLVHPAVAEEVPELPWPQITEQELEPIKQQIRQRADAVVIRLLPKNTWVRPVASLLWKLKLGELAVEEVTNRIRADLADYGLFTSGLA